MLSILINRVVSEWVPNRAFGIMLMLLLAEFLVWYTKQAERKGWVRWKQTVISA